MEQNVDFCLQIKNWMQGCSSVVFLLTFGAVYTSYYTLCVVKRPVIACKDAKLKQFLFRHCPIFHEKYWPTFWCFGSRSITLIRGLLQSTPSGINYKNDLLKTPDGGEIMLHWEDNETSHRKDDNTLPIVLLLPGLTGCSKQTYIMHLVKRVKEKGYRCVVFNYRGYGGANVLTPRTFCAANTEDLEFVVKHIKAEYPNAPLIATGLSLGGMILFNYIAGNGSKCGLLGAMIISVAWNVDETVKSLEKPLNKLLFNRTLTFLLNQDLKKHSSVLERHFDLDYVLQSTNIRDFDDRFTRKMFGYRTCQDLYRDASLHEKCHHIEIPLLCLSAADDVFSPGHAIPTKDAEENDHMCIVVTSRGGHIGFCEGLFPRYETYSDRMFIQFVDAMFKYGQKELGNDRE